MKQDKFLIGILVGIALLVIVAVVTVLARAPGSEAYISDDTPAGVVHNYFLALQRKDYDKAYAYLSDDLENKPDMDQFIIEVDSYGNDNERSLKIGEVREGDAHTQVELSITNYQVGNIFESNHYTSNDTALLRANDAGEWKLIQFPYPYWGWNWNGKEG